MAPANSFTSINLSLLLLLSILSIQRAIGSEAPDPNLIHYNCTGADNFTANSFYSTNLKQLLPALASKAASNAFYNLTAGSDPNTVYGLYYCRGDLASQDCNDCVNTAATNIVLSCPVEKEAIIWYKACTLRYSNSSIFSVYDGNKPGWISWGYTNASNPTQFMSSLSKIFNQLAHQASSNTSAKNYAKGSINVTDSQTIYCLVQCTPDLNSTECSRCLDDVRFFINYYLSSARIQASLDFSSCRTMYDIAPFGPLAPITPSPPPSPPPAPRKSVIPIASAAAGAAAVVLIVGVLLFRFRHRSVTNNSQESGFPAETDGETGYRVEGTTQFDLRTMRAASENFSPENKLGEGGFGSVYKGKLQNGQEVAIKRLSKETIHGVTQFITEVELVVKLQHKNLVRLVGFCAEGEERLIVYEFMPKLSLDYYLFDCSESKNLPWKTRYKIIEGIARGLHYLHEDSRLKVVHRDLKASNILLDDDMNPKIADFGIAKHVVLDQTQGNTTTKIVGTRGYMAPEYALAGQYSVKSDVYSFGVLLLEIVSGQSNNQRYQLEHSEGLLDYAWKRWTEGDIDKLIDPSLQNTVPRMEVGRCIQIGLLCAQYDAASRPTTHAVLLMLNSRNMELPSPSPPSPLSRGTDIPY